MHSNTTGDIYTFTKVEIAVFQSKDERQKLLLVQREFVTFILFPVYTCTRAFNYVHTHIALLSTRERDERGNNDLIICVRMLAYVSLIDFSNFLLACLLSNVRFVFLLPLFFSVFIAALRIKVLSCITVSRRLH